MTYHLRYADFLRSISILFVVIIHNFHFTSYNMLDSFFNVLIFSILKTSVPIFIMLSGALLLQKNESWCTFYNKRIKKVFLPWIIWTSIFVVINKLLNIRDFHSISEFKNVVFSTLFTELWFIPMIIGIYLITPLWKTIAKKKNKTLIQYILLLWFIFCSFIPFIHESSTFPLSPQGFFINTLYYSFYYILGYAITSHILLFKNIKVYTLIGSICIIANYFDYTTYKNAEHTFSYFSPTIVILSYIIFCLFFTINNNKYKLTKTSGIMSAISKASFSIYIIHHLLMIFLHPILGQYSLIINEINGGISGILIGCIYFILSFIIVFLMQKIPKLKYIFP